MEKQWGMHVREIGKAMKSIENYGRACGRDRKNKTECRVDRANQEFLDKVKDKIKGVVTAAVRINF